jgi:hypothetical protein
MKGELNMHYALRRLLMSMLACVLLISIASPVWAAEEKKPGVNMDIGIFVDGQLLVPINEIADVLKADFTWNEQTAVYKKANTTVTMTIGETAAQLNGKALTLTMSPRVEYEQVFVPLELFTQAFGYAGSWNAEKEFATVDTPDITLYIMGHPYFEWDGFKFVYIGDLQNGVPHGEGMAVLGTSLYDGVWYEGQWNEGVPVQMQIDGVRIYVNGNYLDSEYPTIVRNDVVYVPVWPLVAKMRLTAEANGSLLHIQTQNRFLIIGPNSNRVTYIDTDSKVHQEQMAYPIVAENYVLYAPITFIIDYMGAQAAWGDNQRIDLTMQPSKTKWNLDKYRLNTIAQQMERDIAAEQYWRQYAGAPLWTDRTLRTNSSEKFAQYAQVSIVSYNGINVTLTDGEKTIEVPFSSPDMIPYYFHQEDPLGVYNWSADTKNLIRQGKVRIGMNTEQVRMSWGEPDHVTANSYIAQWVYQYDRFNAQYLYFTDGILELFY